MQNLLHALQLQLQSWVVLDWFIAASLAVSTCSAFLKGFIASLISLLGMCAGLVTAAVYGSRGATSLQTWFGSLLVARLVTFLLILVVVYLSVTLAGQVLRGIFHAIGFGLVDRVAGAFFGLLRGVLLLAALALVLKPYLQHMIGGRPSVLLPYLLRVSHGVFSVVPQHMTDHLCLLAAPACR